MADPNLNVHRINGWQLPSPTAGKWIAAEQKGIDGAGIKRYNRFYSYEITWDYLNLSEYELLITIWKGQYNSGTSAIRVPPYDFVTGSDWLITGGFVNLSGVIVDRPEYDRYDNKYHRGVKMLIRRINIS